nr:cyclic-guanylate-specific phosphodiesterase [Affinibrenneria salicis]
MVEPSDEDYWQRCQRKYTFQPIYRTSGQLIAIELLTAVFSPAAPQTMLSPEKYFASIEVEKRLQIIIEQLELLAQWHERFSRDELVASVNIDGITLVALQESLRAKNLIATMPWLRFELVENQKGAPPDTLIMLPEAENLWLDDFGCGIANFSSLIVARYDCIKVARELFILLLQSDEGKRLFPLLISLIRRFCNNVIIEGVETREEWEIVKKTKASAAQGYYFARPQSFDKLADLPARFEILPG